MPATVVDLTKDIQCIDQKFCSDKCKLSNNLSKSYFPLMCNNVVLIANAFECQISDKTKSDAKVTDADKKMINDACKFCQYFNDKTAGIVIPSESVSRIRFRAAPTRKFYSSVDSSFFEPCKLSKEMYDSQCTFSPIYYETL